MFGKEARKLSNIVLMIFVIIILLIGMFIGILKTRELEKKVEKYIPVTVSILKVKEVEKEGKKLYQLTMEYDVNGKKYKNDNITYKGNDLEKDKKIKVYYNPDDIYDVVMQSEIESHKYTVKVLALFAIILMPCLFNMIRKYKKEFC